jgi:hypothetical protein
MARTPKIKRRWIKEEKQIVELLYKKGFIKGEFKLEDLYWESYNWFNKKCYKTKPNPYDGKRYRFPIYMPEIHFSTSDYWGESDEHSVVDAVLERLYWEHIDTTNFDPNSYDEYPVSTFPRMTRGQFIKYLKGLPTKVGDNKIKKVLKKTNEYD